MWSANAIGTRGQTHKERRQPKQTLSFGDLQFPDEPFLNFRASKNTDFYVVQECRATDFKAEKFGKGSPGSEPKTQAAGYATAQSRHKNH